VHARKAWLQGLSAKENREIPPLRYELVHRLKQEFPALAVTINGGITKLDEAAAHLPQVDGVMIGRAAYQNPYVLAEVDRRFFGDTAPAPTRHEIVARMYPYIEREVAAGVPLKSITRHVLGLFNGQRGARAWRRFLSENAPPWRRFLSENAPRFDGGPGEAVALLENAAALVPQDDSSVAAA
jgi:tRNA-dihydrouridine synthase A